MEMNHRSSSTPSAFSHFVSTALILAVVLVALPAFGGEKQVVNINEASESQLALLPRVGPAIAARIVEFRDENGKFQAPEDLMLVRGIGEKTYALMKPYVTVSGETTLTSKAKAAPPASEDDSKEKSDD